MADGSRDRQCRVQGQHRCDVVAPELFDVDDYGAATVPNHGIVPVDPDPKARLTFVD